MGLFFMGIHVQKSFLECSRGKIWLAWLSKNLRYDEVSWNFKNYSFVEIKKGKIVGHRRIWGHILGGAHINSGPYEEKWPRLQ